MWLTCTYVTVRTERYAEYANTDVISKDQRDTVSCVVTVTGIKSSRMYGGGHALLKEKVAFQ